jgi:hypothetical protein
MVNYARFKPVSAISAKGRLLVGILRFFYALRRSIWQQFDTHLVPQHHEDPLKMTFAEKLYMGQKYYYKAMINPEEGTDTASHFARQHLLFHLPKGFTCSATITLGAGGDLIPYKPVNAATTAQLWQEAGPFFFDNQLVFANLETVADPQKPFSAAPEVMLADMFFNIDAACFDIFNGNGQFRGFDVLSTANNHSMDLGEAGILATIDFLKQRRIAHCGTAASTTEADDFPILERQGIKVAFLAYTFSLNKARLPPNKPWLCNHIFLNESHPDLSLIVRQTALARQRGADVVVASLHMGCAYQAYPSRHTISNMHAICAEAGVDVLLGGHAHHPQPMEVYKHRHKSGRQSQHLIVYALGDFVAYDIFKWSHLALLLKIHLGKGALNGQPHAQVLGFEAKPFYMERSPNGQLQLVDLERIRLQMPIHYTKRQRREVAELANFFDQFVLLPAQQRALARQPWLGQRPK